jgi:c-di-GMP-binding flagellar brake protein YcgR
MKCERRRNTRVTVQIPVVLVNESGAGQRKAVTSDISQGGMSVRLSRRARKSDPMRVKFTLPGTDDSVECAAETAWDSGGVQAGIRFVNLSPDQRERLKSWLGRHSLEMEPDDPPVPCKLTDLSSGGCYLEMAAPLPVNTRVLLTMRIPKFESRAEGVVRVMHPEIGMGVEFTRTTKEQREHLEEFIKVLTNSKGIEPELLVEPEGMNDAEAGISQQTVLEEMEDPLLELFQGNKEFTTESFFIELRRQRNPLPHKTNATAAV